MKHELYPATTATLTHVAPLAAGAELYAVPGIQISDQLHRVISSSSYVMHHQWNTFDVYCSLSAWHKGLTDDIDALKVVANYQRKYINYQATYSAYLLGTLTPEEFELESDGFMSEEKSVDPAVLAPMIKRIENLLHFNLNERELAEYLEVDQNSVTEALAILPGLDLAQPELPWSDESMTAKFSETLRSLAMTKALPHG